MKKVISSFCLLSVFFLNNILYAQIIYTDILPDATPNATYPLDLDNDSVADFIIQYAGSAGSVGVMCYPQNNNAYAGEFMNGTYLPWANAQSDSICPSLATWYGAMNPGFLALGTALGNWVGQTNKYLALKLIVGANTYYGWARLDVVATSTSFTIKDYAYNSTPNVCIQSGQTISGIKNNSSKNIFSILPNPFISSTTIKTLGNLKNATLTVVNAYGQTLKELKNISGQSVSLARDNLQSGLYFIKITEGNKIIAVEKLIIID